MMKNSKKSCQIEKYNEFTWTAASIRCPFCSTIVTGTYWGGGGCKGAAWGWTAT